MGPGPGGLESRSSRVGEGSGPRNAKSRSMARKSRRPARSIVVRRWLAVGALVLIALLYYRPIKGYIDAQGQLGQGKQVVQKLRADKLRLERRLVSSNSIPTLAREARALGYVRPGERLYIVKG